MKIKQLLKNKNIEISAKKYGIDAMGAMAQGLFASLLVGTILETLGTQLGMLWLKEIGGFAKSVSGPAMAISIAYALSAPMLVMFSLAAVGFAANSLGGAGGPLAVLIISIIATACAAAPSSAPVNPRRSSVVALTLTLSTSTVNANAIFSRFFSL